MSYFYSLYWQGTALNSFSSGNLTVGTAGEKTLTAATGSIANLIYGTASGGIVNYTTGSGAVSIAGTGSFANLIFGTASGGIVNFTTASGVAIVAGTGSFSNLLFGTGSGTILIASTVSAGLVTFTSASGGSLFIGSDTLKAWFGAGNDMSVWYDGTNGKIVTNDVAASDLIVNCGTNKTIVLGWPVYDDLLPTPITSARLGASAPTLTVFVGSIEQYTFDNSDDYVIGATELIHSYKEGTPIEAHIHWATAAATTREERVKFQLKATPGNASSAFGAEQTFSVETIIPAATVDRKHMITTVGTLTTAMTIGGYFAWRFERVTISAGTEIADPFVLAIGWHYLKDTLGSRQEYVK